MFVGRTIAPVAWKWRAKPQCSPLHLKPYTLHTTPYTLHPTPCTLKSEGQGLWYHRNAACGVAVEVEGEGLAHLVNLEVPEVGCPLVYIPLRRALV